MRESGGKSQLLKREYGLISKSKFVPNEDEELVSTGGLSLNQPQKA